MEILLKRPCGGRVEHEDRERAERLRNCVISVGFSVLVTNN